MVNERVKIMEREIFYNGDIMTLENEGEYVEAVYVEDGIIKKCGSINELKELAGDVVKITDLEGKTMIPAFIDPHSHFASVGQMATSCDLADCTNFDQIVQALKKHIEEKKIPEGEMVTGINYDHNYLEEKAHPTKDVLDRVSTKHLIVVCHTSGHLGSVNSLVLEKMGLNDDSEFGMGGKYARYEGSRELNGHMEENAFMAARRLAKAPSKEEMEELVLAGQEEYLKNGITTVQNGGSMPEQMDILMDLAEKDQFTLDVVNYMMIAATTKEQMDSYKKYIGKYYNRLKVGGYKMFLDGSPQGKTAWMSEPYEGETEYRGYPVLTDEAAKSFAERAISEKMQLLTHCNGDAASEQLINAYTQAEDGKGIKSTLRPVMIHSQTVREDQLERMTGIGMIPSIFVAHTYYWGDIHLKNMGEKRGNNVSPAKTALDKGHIINFHQDTPVLKPNMIETIWCAVNRITKSGREIGPEQRISVYEALRAVTYGGAYEYFEENEKGTIKEGKVADLVILSENPMKIDKMKIRDIKVLETYKNGELVYSLK